MVEKDPVAFTSEGSINPLWTQHINDRDALTSEIAAHFLSGEKLKLDVNCLATECVLRSRTCKFDNKETKKVEHNPMMLCFFCNRTFHTACYDLDSHLIREETVPWKCSDCRRDLLNKHCQSYFEKTQYKDSLLQRRAKLLLSTCLPESEEDLTGDPEFCLADIGSFERRAIAIMADEDPDSIKDITAITPLLLKKVMQSKSDKKASIESAERYRLELEKKIKEVEQLKLAIAREPANRHEASQNETIANASVSDSPSFSEVHHSSRMNASGSDRTSNSLLGHYLGRDRPSELETSSYLYRPQDISRRDSLAASPVHQANSPQSSQQLTVDQSDLASLVARLALQNDKKEERKLLDDRRKAMPKMIEFSGEESKWLIFKRDVERYRQNCQYDDETVKTYMRGALKGEAYLIVRDIIEDSPIEDIMEHLKRAFGDEMRMVRNRSEELRNFKFGPILHKTEAVKLQVAIQSYFAACNYANIGYINTNIIAEAIFSQFSIEDRQRCREFYEQKNPGCTTIVMNVQTIYNYLMSRMPLLDDAPIKKKAESDNKPKAKAYQMNSTNFSSSQPNDNYKFELKDKIKAPYIGYHMDKVASLSKECELCHSRDHFALQCSRYKEKSEGERLRIISDRKLCKNCVLTSSHRAIECELKGNCGFKLDKLSRCTGKHHISIHRVESEVKRYGQSKSFNKRRSNTRKNTANAEARKREAAAENTPTPSAPQAETPETTANASAAFQNNAIDADQREYTVHDVGCAVNTNSPKSVKVFRVKIWGPKGYIIALAVGDSGSEVTMVRDDLRRKLELEGKPHTLNLQWADKTRTTFDTKQVDIQIQGMDKGCEKFNLNNCFSTTSLNLPKRTLDMKKLRENFPNLRKVPFDGYEDEDPVMLIGSPHASLIEGCELVENGESGPIALKTKIGWTVYGGSYHLKSSEIAPNQVNEVASIDEEIDESSDDDNDESEKKVSNEKLHKMLVEYNSVESLGIRATQTQLTEKETKAIEILKEEIKILSNGTVEAPLVWNRDGNVIPKLPNNYQMALKRQFATEKSLQKDPARLNGYNDNVKELIRLGFLRQATENDLKINWDNIWYLPMSLTVNENKNPPKMRNVYDASCVYKGESLNRNLLKGPDLLVNILQPLLRMRMNEVAFTADVKAMFNMIRICERDQQCQRILWRENFDQPMKTYVATVMLFGPTSSPFTSQYVKNTTAELWIDRYPDAARTLIEQTYMDDVLTSEPSVEKAHEVAMQCIEICKSINWELVSFQSNSIELLKSLPPNAVKKDAIPLPESENDNHVTKVLGCFWNTKDDCFEFKLEKNLFIQMVKEFNIKPTKRDQASTLARIYDVLGLISFFTVRGKILLQRSWVNKINWDQPIDDKTAKEWKNWLQQWHEIAKLKFPRRYAQIDALRNAEEIKLHIFCDAGTEAFGTAAYLVVKFSNGIESNLVMAKAKVTPLRLKTETAIKEMPRLELMAALLAARLCQTIIKLLNDITMTRHFWCDSEVALRWIKNPDQKLLKYAIGPVEEILELTDRREWRYIPTHLNVADLCTKMKKIDFSSDAHTWMHGPEFIKLSEEHWPQFPEKSLNENCLTINNIYARELIYSTHKLPPIDCPIASDDAIDRLRSSIKCSWLKLRRAIARALKLYMDAFIPLVQTLQFSKINKVKQLRMMGGNLNYLSTDDLERAEHFIYRKIQRDAFPEEYKALKAGKPIRNPEMIQLNVFMDPEGLIRINSRVNLNSENFPQQFTPLLPRKSPYVTALLAYYHNKFIHIATESQVAEIRSQVWIPQLKTALRSIKARCNWCRIKNAFPYSPRMAPLPIERIDPQLKPFEITGVDILGPLRPTVNGNTKKVYILIFVCTLTRYIHLHLLDSLESLRVLEAIVVFWTAYGPVRKFISDNGTNFKKTAKTIREDEERAKFFARHQPVLGTKLAELYRVEWQFIAVHAPWFGGMYERLIKEVKRSLSGTLERRKLSRTELNIAVHEAAHRINCRPLTENSLDAEDEEILTPHHLAKNRSGWPLLPGIHKGTYSVVPERSVYRRGRIIADEIMRQFTARYLPVLTKRTKWHKNETPAKVGDLVLVIEPNKTRKQWDRAKIIKIRLGRDGIARVADVRMFDGRIKKNRAIRNLAKLNLSKDLNETAENENNTVTNVTVNSIFELDENESDASTPRDLVVYNDSEPKNQFENKDSIMAANKGTGSENFILIEGVDSSMKLSNVIEELAPQLSSIVSIYRVHDYIKRINSENIILTLLDTKEYDTAAAARHEINANNDFKFIFPDFIAGTGYFPTNFSSIEEDRIAIDPKPLYVYDLPKLKKETSIRLSKVLQTLENFAEVTGFKWNLGSKHNVTRNFGFAMLNDKPTVLRLAGQRIRVDRESIRLDLCNSTTVVIHSSQRELLNAENKAILTPRLSQANWLHADVVISDDIVPSEIESIQVTIPNNNSIQLTQSAPVMEVRDDTVVINIENHELSDVEAELDQPVTCNVATVMDQAGTSSPHTDVHEPSTSATAEDNELRTRETVKAIAPKVIPINVSRFIRMRMHGSYPFTIFNRRVMQIIREFSNIVYFEREESATAYIEFKNVKTAVKVKKILESFNKEKQVSIKYSEEKGIRVIQKVKSRERSPKEDTEIIYYVNEQGSIIRCKAGEQYNDFIIPSGDYVAN